jgi:sugar phosphate isomerase/epimerase
MGTPTKSLWWDAALSTMWAVKRFEHLPDFVTAARQIGFRQFELNHQIDSRMLAELDYNHLTITAVHEPCPADIPTSELKSRDWLLSAIQEDNRHQGLKAILRSVDLAQKVGARFVIVHLGTVLLKPQWEDDLRRLYNTQWIDSAQAVDLRQRMVAERAAHAPAHLNAVQKSLDELVEYASQVGVCLGIENRYHFADIPHPNEMEMLLRDYTPDQVCFWYDSGHAQALDRLGFFSHETWLQCFVGRMRGMHLHDVRGIVDHFTPGIGELDWTMVARYAPDDALRTLELKPENSPEEVVLGMQRLVEMGIVQPLG